RRPNVLPVERRNGRHGALGAPSRVRRDDMLNVPVVVSWVPQRLAAAEGARRSEEAHETATRRSIRLRSALVALAGWALAAPALAITPSLVADIHPGFQSEGSNPHGFVAVGGRSLFISGDDVLWSTAGV